MSTSEKAILKDTQRGAAVEADGNAPTQSVQVGGGISLALDSQGDPQAQASGPNNERLEQVAPRLVNALRELVVQFRQEGVVARRHEIRRIRQARLFWQGLQYAWWNPQDMNWHLPWEAKIYDDSALEEMPRYQFVTNLYQAFGLSFISVISQDVPATRFYPQSTLNEADIETAKAASQVADLIEQNNRVQQLLTGVGFYLWTAKLAVMCATLPTGSGLAGATNCCWRSGGFGWGATRTSARSAGRKQKSPTGIPKRRIDIREILRAWKAALRMTTRTQR